jgi:hypothetical protein
MNAGEKVVRLGVEKKNAIIEPCVTKLVEVFGSEDGVGEIPRFDKAEGAKIRRKIVRRRQRSGQNERNG